MSARLRWFSFFFLSSMITPHLRYCISYWNPDATVSAIYTLTSPRYLLAKSRTSKPTCPCLRKIHAEARGRVCHGCQRKTPAGGRNRTFSNNGMEENFNPQTVILGGGRERAGGGWGSDWDPTGRRGLVGLTRSVDRKLKLKRIYSHQSNWYIVASMIYWIIRHFSHVVRTKFTFSVFKYLILKLCL